MPARTWCLVVAVIGGCCVTGCRGRWPVNSDDAEYHDSPPHTERCDYCERVRIDPVEAGLAELREQPFDLGGEA